MQPVVAGAAVDLVATGVAADHVVAAVAVDLVVAAEADDDVRPDVPSISSEPLVPTMVAVDPWQVYAAAEAVGAGPSQSPATPRAAAALKAKPQMTGVGFIGCS
jgi:hypothetical protein